MSDNRKPVWRRIIKYVVFILIIVAALIGLNMFFSSRTVETYTPPLKNVVTAKAERRDIKESITVSSYVESQSMVPVVPFVSGTIEEYNIEAGDKVEEGDVIAVIDKEPYELQVAQAEAALSAYSSSYERLIRLQEAGAATQQDIDTVKAQLDAAQAQEELAQLQLSYTDVTAPVAGSIIMASSSKGSPAGSQSPVAVIADTSALVVNAEVSERYYSILTSSRDNLEITVCDKDGVVSSDASLVSIAPYINPSSKTFTVKVRIDDPSLFTIGMYVKVNIAYASYDDVMTLPQSVRKADGSLYYVEAGCARYIPPFESAGDDEHFIVPSGYENKEFIVEGQNSVLDGEKVNIVESAK